MTKNVVFSLMRFVSAYAVFFLLWVCITAFKVVPEYFVPSPFDVFARLSDLAVDGVIYHHVFATMIIVAAGLLLGTLFGFLAGVAVLRFRFFADHVLPLIIGIQSVPLVAFAPLFLLWFGGGFQAKVSVATLVVLFPIFTATVEAFRKQNVLLGRLFYSLGASRFDTWMNLRFPLAVPQLYTGFKTSVPLALVGATVAEFLGTDKGLGFLMQTGVGLFDTPLVFGTVLILATLGLLLYGAVVLFEKIFLQRFFNS